MNTLQDEVHIFVIGAREPECANLDVADKEDGHDGG